MRSLGEKLPVLRMKKLLVLLLASAMAPMLSAADFSTGGRPTTVIGGHTFDRLDYGDGSSGLGSLHKFGMSFVCYDDKGVTCITPDPRAKGRVWTFLILSDSLQQRLNGRSVLCSIDIDCGRYMGTTTSSEVFSDVYGENSKSQSSDPVNWEPIKPGSTFDMAGRLVCQQK